MTTRKSSSPVAPRAPAGASSKTAGGLTSERISDDLAAFQRAGGRIEVLGTTRVLARVAEMEENKAKAPKDAKGR